MQRPQLAGSFSVFTQLAPQAVCPFGQPHAPHAHVFEHVCEPVPLQVRIAPLAHSPSPMQADHPVGVPSALQPRICMPQFPQLRVSGAQHAPHWHELEQLRDPPPVQVIVVSGAHSPSPLQDDQSPNVPSGRQLRVRVPQLPQRSVWGVQQPPHAQLSLQVREPPSPQSIVAPGLQSPSALQADQSPSVPSGLQLRVRVPQLPQLSVCGVQHVPHMQASLHVRCPPFWQLPVAPGMH